MCSTCSNSGHLSVVCSKGVAVTTVVDMPVEEISERAREVRFGRTVLTVFAAVFFAVGWVVSKAWLGLVWCAIAVQVGWRDARRAAGDD